MSDYESCTWNVGRSYLSMGSWEGQNASYRHGLYRHPLGLVEVYECLGRHGTTSMRFIYGGTEFVRRWSTTWGDKTLARLARELVEDVVSGASS
jgi:hypothetical protein